MVLVRILNPTPWNVLTYVSSPSLGDYLGGGIARRTLIGSARVLGGAGCLAFRFFEGIL